METDEEKCEERKIIKFVTNIILYLLLAMAFFSFKELGVLGVRNVTLYFFLSAIMALIILSFMFVAGKKSQRIYYVFTIPFILYSIMISVYLLFADILIGESREGVSDFIHGWGIVILTLLQSEQIIFVIIFMILIQMVCVVYLMGKGSCVKK